MDKDINIGEKAECILLENNGNAERKEDGAVVELFVYEEVSIRYIITVRYL